MALTMTRTRTQTTLTKLAELVACLHSELAFVEALQADAKMSRPALLGAHHDQLMRHRDALYLTIRQFDPTIDPASIGASNLWQRRFGRLGLSPKTLKARLLGELSAEPKDMPPRGPDLCG